MLQWGRSALITASSKWTYCYTVSCHGWMQASDPPHLRPHVVGFLFACFLPGETKPKHFQQQSSWSNTFQKSFHVCEICPSNDNSHLACSPLTNGTRVVLCICDKGWANVIKFENRKCCDSDILYALTGWSVSHILKACMGRYSNADYCKTAALWCWLLLCSCLLQVTVSITAPVGQSSAVLVAL